MMKNILARMTERMHAAYDDYDDIAIKAPVILQEATIAIEYSCESTTPVSLIYEIVSCAKQCDFRLSTYGWKRIIELLDEIHERGFDYMRFEDIENVLSDSPSWYAKKAIIKIALEAVKGTK